MNKVILIGRLAMDPELKYTQPSGVAVSTFRVAVNRPFKNAQGEREADFINIVVWRQTAEFAANYLGRGRLVAIEGRLQVRTYDDKNGVRRWVTEVVADNLQALDRKPDGAEGGHSAPGHSGGMGDDVPSYEDPFQEE